MNEMIFISKHMVSGHIYEVNLFYWSVSSDKINIKINVLVPMHLSKDGFIKGSSLDENIYPAEFEHIYEISKKFLNKFFPYAKIEVNEHKYTDIQ